MIPAKQYADEIKRDRNKPNKEPSEDMDPTTGRQFDESKAGGPSKGGDKGTPPPVDPVMTTNSTVVGTAAGITGAVKGAATTGGATTGKSAAKTFPEKPQVVN